MEATGGPAACRPMTLTATVAAAGIVQLPTAAVVVAIPTIHAQFNASVAEVGYQDTWQRATLGVAVVSGEAGGLDRVLRDILAVVEREDRLQVLDYQIRIY